MPLLDCPLCLEPRKARPAFRVQAYEHARCLACGSVFIHPPPSQEDLARYYASGAYYAKAEAEQARLGADAAARAALLRARAPGTRLLDVGCASGIFLRAAAEAGFEADGIEWSPATADEARRRSGRPVHVGDVFKLSFSPGEFQVITAFEVLEHMTDPHAFLRRLNSWLGPGALLGVSTPNMSSLLARVMGPSFPMVIPPEHVSLFSRRALDAALRRAGFAVEHRRSFSGIEREQFTRGLDRYLVSRLPRPLRGPAEAIGRPLARFGVASFRALDLAGLGTETLVIARKVGAP